jgi:hypothetical protein
VSWEAVEVSEGRPYPRFVVGRWKAVRGRFGTECTADLSARQMVPSRVRSCRSVRRPRETVKCFPMRRLRMALSRCD